MDGGAASQTAIDLALSTLVKLGSQFYLDGGLRILALNLSGELSETSTWFSVLWQPQSAGFGASLNQRYGTSQVDRNRLFSQLDLADIEVNQALSSELEGEVSYTWLLAGNDLKFYSKGKAQQESIGLNSQQTLASMFNDRIGMLWSKPSSGFSLDVEYKLGADELDQTFNTNDYFQGYLSSEQTELNLKASIKLP